ncbi:MAG: FliM/FliN family flagellar motor switch protein [Planctomycetota bacterium]|jgi:flagellar motor switch/type III secretory pathway protein FliN|nr:FliM/FliN family flagellar motor switch protein [Planctomycetota bacterium]
MSTGIVNPVVLEKGGALVKALMEGGSAGWSTLLGKNITYAIIGSDYGRPDEVVKPAEIPEAVVTQVDWSGDASGKVQLLTPPAGAREVVAHMMALMLGGDPNPDDTRLDAEGMDAYSEAVNSYFGQGAQQARSEIGGSIKTAVGASKLVDFSKTPPGKALGGSECYCAKVKVNIEGRPPFTLEILVDRSVTGTPPAEEHAGAPDEAAAGKLGVDPANLGIAMKIKIPLIVNIAAKMMRMELIQNMRPGTIIEFKKMSGENLDVLAGNIRVAMAEAVIINQCFGIQIRGIVDPRQAIKD